MDEKKGSIIAKSGFENEKDVVKKFNNWENDEDSQEWLKIMGYNLDEIESVSAEIIRGYKTDVQVQISVKLHGSLDFQNIQVKLVSNKQGFNQIDKRWVDKYKHMWRIPDEITLLLKYYTGEIEPYTKNVKDSRRMFLTEFSSEEQEKIIDFFETNKTLIVCDIIKGRGKFSAEWMLVAQKVEKQKWILKPINEVLNYYSQGKVRITPRGSLKIGKITMQRKGGDAGRETSQMLQFKINPAELFDI